MSLSYENKSTDQDVIKAVFRECLKSKDGRKFDGHRSLPASAGGIPHDASSCSQPIGKKDKKNRNQREELEVNFMLYPGPVLP